METEPRQPKPTTAQSPLVPQGTLPDGRGKSHIRIAVFSILAVHAVLLGTLLIFGCKKAPDQTADQSTVLEPTNNAFPAPPPQMAFAPTQFPEPSHAPPPPLSTTTSAIPEPPSLPTAASQQPSAPAASDSAREHVVLKGESFYTIAKKYSTTSRAISQANPGVDPTRLKIGQKLVIPSASQTASAMAATEPASPAGANGDRIHTVKAGENLTVIARRHGVAVKEIQAANNLRTTQIRVGQKLRLPEKAGSPASAEVIPPLTPASSTAAQAVSAPAVPQ